MDDNPLPHRPFPLAPPGRGGRGEGRPASRSQATLVRAPAILALVCALGACAPQATPAKPGVNLSGFPPEFREGYSDGCNSARSVVGTKKDEARMKSDPQYAQGWRDGYDMCKGRKP